MYVNFSVPSATTGRSPPKDGRVEQGHQGRAVGRPRREPVGRRPAPGRPEHHRHVQPLPGVDKGGVRRQQRPPSPRREARRRDGPQPLREGTQLGEPYASLTASTFCIA